MEPTLASARPDAPTPPAELSPRQRTLVLAAMCLALVLVVAGVSMLTNAMPHISEALGLGQTTQTWVLDSYTVALASLLLVAGAIGDRYCRRGALLTGVVIFGVGNALSALAGSGGSLIGFRAIAGVGAALIMPGTLSTITSVFPPEERARAVGIWAGFAGAGGMLGMLGSGALLEWFSWESVFVVTAALSAVTFLFVAFAVPTSRSSEKVGLDPLGTVLSAVGIGALVLGIIEGPERGWSDPITLLGVVGGAALLVAFFSWERRVESPLLDPSLFRYRGFTTGSASLLVLFLAMFGVFVTMLGYLQLILGYAPLKAAAGLIPMMAVVLPLSTVAATLATRYGQRLIGAAGLLISGAGLLSFTTLQPTSSYWHFLGCLMVMGIGFGLAMTPATNAIVSSLPKTKQGVASAVNDTTREVGSALGVAITGSAFNVGYRHAIEGHLGGLSAGDAARAHDAPAIALQVARTLGSGGDALAAAARESFLSGVRVSSVVGAGLLVVGAAFTWFHGPSKDDEAIEDDVDAPSLDDELAALRVEPATVD